MRHGATEWNETRRAQGWADIELSDLGRKQAESAAKRFKDVPLVAVYSSALVRAIETAQPIADAHGLEVQIDPAFNEIDQGKWTGLSTAEISRRWPDLFGANRHFSPRPGGESPPQVRKRALEGIERIAKAYPTGTVLLVSHGGTIRWISAEALGFDDHESMTIRGLANGEAVLVDATINSGHLRVTDLRRWDGHHVQLDEHVNDPNA